MVKIHNRAALKSISVKRVIRKIVTNPNGPVVIFFGGIHGNESAGVFALDSVLNNINPKDINGVIYGISGNLKALEKGLRYIEKDLNRIWNYEKIAELKEKNLLDPEESEQRELYYILNEILSTYKDPFYFIDLHTTSSKTLPFITINDSIINRKFAQLFPVPIVLGIEEYLNGPLLSFINTYGYVTIGFESGQHDDEQAITCAIAFVNLVLGYTCVIDKSKIENFEAYHNLLKLKSLNTTSIYEIIHLHSIQNDDSFKMLPNFTSFQNIKKGTPLAINNNRTLFAEHDSVMFMPLYQQRGDDGYFLIKEVHPFFLKLSELLRKIRADSVLPLLPGISWDNREKGVLYVNLRVAKFFAKALFHLLGYRNRQLNNTHIKIYNRERVSKHIFYTNEKWYR